MKTCYDEFLDSRGVFSSVTEKGGGHMFGEVTSVQKKATHIYYGKKGNKHQRNE